MTVKACGVTPELIGFIKGCTKTTEFVLASLNNIQRNPHLQEALLRYMAELRRQYLLHLDAVAGRGAIKYDVPDLADLKCDLKSAGGALDV
jgi:hypothetical protein